MARFKNLQDLARLPWFEAADEGRVALRDRGIGPVVDMHTHLALGYVRPFQVDLGVRHACTEHYLPVHNPLDFEVYVNRNFTRAQLGGMKRDLTMRSFGPGGMRRTHTAANLVAEMDEMGIAHSVLLPIDLPGISDNAGVYLAAAAGQSRLVGFGSVHPYSLAPEKRLREQVARGARGIKLHPAVQMVRPDDPRAGRLYRVCGEHGVPVLWHCGPVGIEPVVGRFLSLVRWYERPIAENPGTTFILGHSGALQAERALELCHRYPNVVLELSSQGLSWVRTILTQADPERVVYGSDWPFYHQAIALAKILLATEDRPDLRRKVLYDNAARLLKLPA
ncbi:MAG: amidohydrolase family protein [Candidatus Sericytochromatia bacterium]|nr:amidohydrolase family protein [Candidatus Tanganyikabacteria bacterium]